MRTMGGHTSTAIVIALALALVVASGGSARSADALVGTWHVKPGPFPKAPWAKGGDTVTISRTSEEIALPVMESADPYSDGSTLFCGATFEKPQEHPGASWFRLTYTWSGGGALMGCATSPGQGVGFVAGSRYISLSPVPGGLHGEWRSDWGNASTAFPLDLTPGAADTGGGSGGSGGSVKTVAEPAPGAGTAVTSPKPFPSSCSTPGQPCTVGATVTDSSGNLAGTTIVGEGERTTGQAAGQLVATCWLLGPDALQTDNKSLAANLKAAGDLSRDFPPEEMLRYCMFVVSQLPRHEVRTTSSTATVCRVARLAFTIRQGHVVSATKTAPRGAVRYGCSVIKTGLKLSVSGNLKTLGPRLDLGVVRAKSAEKRAAKLKLAYSW